VGALLSRRDGIRCRRSWRALGAILLAPGLAACTARSPAVRPLPAPPPADPSALTVTLAWNAPVDLDLYVTDPTWESLYFGNSPTRTGARLEGDVRCPGLGTPVAERAVVPRPIEGVYRVGVDFIEACETGVEEAPFRIAVDWRGERREASGVARLEHFDVIALDFALRRTDDGSLRLVAPVAEGKAKSQ